ncbi:MAG TPA: GvpL/GvpF family gas vesicle protein, partial [Chloroflexota bacterium]|nr:GvpL/GvpF family gas vesicle protein [Chloroflexota bacterium]
MEQARLMTWHVYAAVAPAELQPAMGGIDGAPVRLLPAGAIAIAASEHAVVPLATPASLKAHARVAMTLGGVPFRFGADAPSCEDLQAQAAARVATLSEQLHAVGDCVEMVVRLPQVAVDRSSGTAYLTAKKRAAEHVEALQQRLSPELRDSKEQGG